MLEVSLALGFRLRLLGPIVSKVKQDAKRSSVFWPNGQMGWRAMDQEDLVGSTYQGTW